MTLWNEKKQSRWQKIKLCRYAQVETEALNTICDSAKLFEKKTKNYDNSNYINNHSYHHQYVRACIYVCVCVECSHFHLD